MSQTSSASKSSSLGRCRPRGASRERVSCTAGDSRPQAPPGLYKPELLCHLKQCSPCSNEVWCFIISLKINYFQGEIFITLNISMPSRAKRHPSPRARQEAPGTKLFSILSPCKCLNKLILNSLHKNSGGGGIGKTPLWHLPCELRSPVHGAVARGGSLTPDCIRSPRLSIWMPRGALRG